MGGPKVLRDFRLEIPRLHYNHHSLCTYTDFCLIVTVVTEVGESNVPFSISLGMMTAMLGTHVLRMLFIFLEIMISIFFL